MKIINGIIIKPINNIYKEDFERYLQWKKYLELKKKIQIIKN